MAARLIVHTDGEHVAWLDDSGSLVRGGLETAAAAAAEREVTVLLPGEQILLTAIDLPPIRQAGRRLQAARFALEDQVVDRVEVLHFALAAKADERGRTVAAVIDLAVLREYMDAFEQAGLDVVQVGADALALPAPEAGQWQVARIGGRILARTSAHHGFACDENLWPALAAGSPSPPEHITIHAASAADAAALGDIVFESQHTADAEPPNIEPVVHDSVDGVLVELLRCAARAPAPLNLRQGAFARRSRHHGWWQPLKITAGLAAAWLVIAIAGRAIESWQLNQRIDRLQTTSRQAFHQAFPRVQTINDLRVQAEQGIQSLRGSEDVGGVFALLQAVASVTGDAKGLSIQSLQYRGGDIYLDLRGKNVQTLENLRAGFANQPAARLTVQSADAAADGVQIRASVSPSNS